MTLTRYNAKRDFTRTQEPSGTHALGDGQSFVVQQHAARRMHWDLRLEIEHVLKSWAVPKGPSFDPDQKRLAVQTEDHPLAYASFEGIIPAGAYGGGAMIVWDRGLWRPLHDPVYGLAKGHLAFELMGQKLKGVWHLVRMGGPDSRNWLLSKANDAAADPGLDGVARWPRSVLSQRTVEQVAQGRAPEHVPAAPLAAVIAPQLATLAQVLPPGPKWLYEVKLDGYRMMAARSGSDVRLDSRNGRDWTRRLPTLAAALLALPAEQFFLDGELVLFAANGASNFGKLQESLGGTDDSAYVLCIFDLLFLDGTDLRPRPQRQRKVALEKLLAAAGPNARLVYWPHVAGAAAGKRALKAACAQGLEGLVAKRADAPYRSGRSQDWLKLKCTQQLALVVGGYVGGPGVLAALLVGQHDGKGSLQYLGRVGTGFGARDRAQLMPRLNAVQRKTSPFADAPEASDVTWVRPKYVAQIRYAELTAEGRLRHASYLGLREDKDAGDVVPAALSQMNADKPARTPRRSKTESSDPAIKISHPERRVVPGSSVTKAELAGYLSAAAPFMLRDLAQRPLSLLRCPTPDLAETFFQKHLTQHLAGLGQVEIDGRAYAFAEEGRGLVGLVQMSVIELHIWGCRVQNVEAVDTLVFDLDPGEGVEPAQIVAAARRVRYVLGELGLDCLLKATGGKGLHVVVPAIAACDWPTAKAVTQLVADYVVATDTAHFTANVRKAARRGKVYIDYLRNGRGATSIAAFSPRARPGLPVARPLAWAALNEAVLHTPWDVPTMLAHLRSGYRDPWARLRDKQQHLAVEIQEEARLRAGR